MTDANNLVYHSKQSDFLLKIHVGNFYFTLRAIKTIIQEEIKNYPDFEIDQLAHAHLPNCTRIGKSPSSSFVYFGFNDLSGLEKSTAFLTAISRRGVRWQKSTLSDQDIRLCTRYSPENRKRQQQPALREKKVESIGVDPWRSVPYEEQLARKKDHCIGVLRNIQKNLNMSTHIVPEDTFCIFSDILSSDIIEGYRNRVDYCIGLRGVMEGEKSNDKPYLGFNIGSFKDGFRGVTSSLHCKTTPIEIVEIASLVEKWIQKWWIKFPDLLGAHNKDTHEGFWRRLSIRITGKKEVMIIMQTMSSNWLSSQKTVSSSSQFNDFRDYYHEIFHSLQTQFVKEFSGKCSSIQWQEFDGRSNAAPFDLSHTLLHGPAALIDHVYGRPFKISASSFFQVNTIAMEKMIHQLRTLDFITSESVVLDICCGTGLIGLCLQDMVHHVVGIDIVPSAIQDARNNAESIGVKNVDYLCGEVERSCADIDTILRKLISRQTAIPETILRAKTLPIIAIVDPPRNGLHKNVIKWMRRSAFIKHLVYISCDQRALERDGVRLAKAPSIEYPGCPFYGVSSFAVDMFPHTPHVEQLLIMKR